MKAPPRRRKSRGWGVADATEDAATVTLPDGSLVIAGGSTVGKDGSGKLTKAYRVTS